MKKYPVSEIYIDVTIQGEGPRIGEPTKFLRMAGCDFDVCSWCDTKYAVNPKFPGWSKRMMTAVEICEELNGGGFTKMITISGGNPALFVDYDLIETMHHGYGFDVAIETQGSKMMPPMALRHPGLKYLVISPKPPSSGMHNNNNVDIVGSMIGHRNSVGLATYLKYVVFDEKDLVWIESFDRQVVPKPTERCLSVGTTIDLTLTDEELRRDILAQTEWLVGQAQSYDEEHGPGYFHDWRITPQLHTLIWGRKRGV